MADPNETAALKASFRGAMATGATLAAITERIEALEGAEEVPADFLEDLARLTAAHAMASAALRGLVETMVGRRDARA